MGYAKITNLYRAEGQTILLLKECYALEKIHGTSASVSWETLAMSPTSEGEEVTRNALLFHSGGASLASFQACFNEAELLEKFKALEHKNVTVYGEGYGGSQQKMSHRYGPTLKFVAFDVQIGDYWLSVPKAEDVCKKLGIEFVHYERVPTDLEVLNRLRDAPSIQAVRNGIVELQPREGIVLRPIVEMSEGSGEHSYRICAKHKRDEERETATPRKVMDAGKLQVLEDANKIALEWVTPTRLEHVLDKLPQGIGLKEIPLVIAAMIIDVVAEGHGEFVDSKEARAAIGKRAVELFKKQVTEIKVI